MASREAQQFLLHLIALHMTEGIGQRSLHKLLKLTDFQLCLDQLSSKDYESIGLRQAQIKKIQNLDLSIAESALRWAEKDNHHIISPLSPFYPQLLKEIPDPPPLLWLMGNPELLLSPQIAIVGSRAPSPGGVENCLHLTRCLADNNLTITSGLAAGIDGAAHRAALETGGHTIAVCGTGLNRVYPAVHRELAHIIAKRGALVSEWPLDSRGNKATFAQRNRIIAGLSLGTLVVEAGPSSGSLITARAAAEYNREVFAVPGSINNPLARGCHQLIKEGAALVDSADDIVSQLRPHALPVCETSLGEQRDELDEQLAEILSFIDYEPTSLDTICERGQLTVPMATNKLLELELSGWIKNIAGGYVRQ